MSNKKTFQLMLSDVDSKKVEEPKKPYINLSKGNIYTSGSQLMQKHNTTLLGMAREISDAAMQAEVMLQRHGKKVDKHSFGLILQHRTTNSGGFKQFLQTMAYNLLLYNNAFAYIVRDKGKQGIAGIKRFEIIPNDLVKVIKLPDDTLWYEIQVMPTNRKVGDGTTERRLISSKNMLHVKGTNSDGIQGIDYLSNIYNINQVNRSMDSNLHTNLTKDKYPFYISQKDNITSNPDSDVQQEMMRIYQTIADGYAEGRGLLVETPLTFEVKEFQKKTEYPNISELYKYIEESVAYLLSYPKAKLSRSSDNVADQYNTLIQQSVAPILTKIEEALMWSCLSDADLLLGYTIVFNRFSLYSSNLPTLAKAYSDAGRMSGMLPNEFRQLANLAPLPEELNVPYIALDLIPAKYAGLVEKRGVDGVPGDKVGSKSDEEDTS